MQIKKALVAGALGVLMLGSTVAFAATLDEYPKPFVDGSSVNTLVVVGGDLAKTSDVAGAVDIAARLGGAATTTTSVSCPGSTSVGTVEGEGRAIHTSSEQIYLHDSLKKSGLRTALSDTDLPTLLASGSVTDSDAGTTYDYDQFIDFPNAINLTFQRLTGKTPNMDKPVYLFDLDTTASTTSSFYRSRVVFNDEVNLTTVVSEDIKLFGKDYTFASESTPTGTAKVVLLGSSVTRTLEEGEQVTVTIDGAQYDVKLLSVGSSTNVGVQVGQDSKSINKGSTATVGGIDIFVDDVFFSSKEGVASSAALFIGARKVILTEGTNVKTKIGSESEKVVDGTFVDLTLSSSHLVGIDVYVQAQSSNADFLTTGGVFADTVWKSFSLNFPSTSIPEDSALRDKIEILPSGTKDATLSFETDRGYKGTVKIANLNSSSQLALSDQDGDQIVVVEGQVIDKNQYFVVDAGDFSRMFEVTSSSSLGTADAEITLRDVFSGSTIDVKLGSDNSTSKVIDGQTYYFNASASTSATDLNLRVTWGDSASEVQHTGRGDFVTVFPVLETKRGAKVALFQNVSVSNLVNSNKLQLPTGALTLSGINTSEVTIAPATTEKSDASVLLNAAGSSVSSINVTADTTFALGKTTGGVRWYRIAPSGTNGTVNLKLAKGKNDASSLANLTYGVGVLLIEEQDDNSDLNSVLVDIGTDTSSGDTRVIVNDAQFSHTRQGTGTLTQDSNTDINYNVDFWGTMSKRDVSDQDKVWLFYPDDQVSANVFVLAEGATIATGSTTSGSSVDSTMVHPIKTQLAKLDSEVTSADKATKHLILVGGPCVNSLVADLAAAGKFPHTCEGWPGSNFGLLQVVDDAFASGRSALVVAGTRASDTRLVASKLQMYESAGLSGMSQQFTA